MTFHATAQPETEVSTQAKTNPERMVHVRDLSKAYHIYSNPKDRLKQIFFGKRKKYYHEFLALKDIQLDVFKGQTLGIVGRNGSGKSTLLQLIVGTLTPTSGRVEVRGRVAALLELGTGFNPEFSGRENIFINAGVLGLSREEIQAKLDAIIRFADIGEFIDQPVKTYSSGMYVRLGFAVAIHVDPDILVVDEALAVGDEAFQRKCFAKIQNFKDGGGTLLFVSHSAGAVIELCDQALCLDQGEMLFSGTPKQVVTLYHKLIYAPPERVERIKREIRQAQDRQSMDLADLDEEQSEEEATGLKDWFDPGMVPKSTTRYQSLGAEIENERLLTLEGKPVNILVNRKEYIYAYDVVFTSECFNVRLGMLIKSISGLEIGGAVTAPVSRGIDFLPKGARLRLQFRFRCALAAGVYFLNAGVLGMVEGAEMYLARHIDAAMFRVQVEEHSLATSMVDFLITPSIESDSDGE